MKASRSAIRRANDSAEVGIGTMIVFIATVLVSAIAASVVIDASTRLQERSSRTGDSGTHQVSDNLQIAGILLKRGNTSWTSMSYMNVTATLVAGANRQDLAQLKIQVNTGQRVEYFDWSNATASSTTFNVTKIRDADGSFTPNTPVLTEGDLFSVNVCLICANLELAPRSQMNFLMVPEIGQPVRSMIFAPASYGLDLIVQIR